MDSPISHNRRHPYGRRRRAEVKVALELSEVVMLKSYFITDQMYELK